MASHPQTGNRVVLLLAALVMVLCSLFVEWGTSSLTKNEMIREAEHQVQVKGGVPGMEKLAIGLEGALLKDVQFPIGAANSAMHLGPVRFPYWAGCVCSGFALLVLILNTIRFSDVSKGYVFLLLATGALVAMWALVNILANGSPGSGAVLLLLGSLIGSCTAVQPPRSPLTT